MEDDLDATVRQLVERRADRGRAAAVASAIDVKDYVTLRGLFCDDIHARYGDVEVDGGDALVEWIDGDDGRHRAGSTTC